MIGPQFIQATKEKEAIKATIDLDFKTYVKGIQIETGMIEPVIPLMNYLHLMS